MAVGKAALVAGLTLASTAMSTVGAMQSASAQASAANYNAQVNEQNAQLAESNAAENLARDRRENRRAIAARTAQAGHSGLALAGSPLQSLIDEQSERELAALTGEYSARLDARGMRQQAGLDRANARNTRRAGFVGAASNVLSGGSTAATRYHGLS